jgi:hypothetical protein
LQTVPGRGISSRKLSTSRGSGDQLGAGQEIAQADQAAGRPIEPQRDLAVGDFQLVGHGALLAFFD